MSDDTHTHSNNDPYSVKIPYTYDLLEDASRILIDFFTSLEKEYLFICQNQEIQIKEVFSDFALLSFFIFDKQPLLDKVCEVLNERSGKKIYHSQLKWIENADAYLGFVPDISQNIKPSRYPILLDALIQSVALSKTLSLIENKEAGTRKIINMDSLAEKFQEYAVTIKPEINDDEDIKDNSDLSSSISTKNKASQTIKIENLINHITPLASMHAENEMEILNLDEIWLDKSLEQYIKPFMKIIQQSGKNVLLRYSELIVEKLAYLPAQVTYDVLQYIDEHHAGLSFHYIMESRNGENVEDFILMDRLAYFFENGLAKELFSPARSRLIYELVNPENNESEKTHLTYQEVMSLKEKAPLVQDKFVDFFYKLELENEDDDDNGEQ